MRSTPRRRGSSAWSTGSCRSPNCARGSLAWAKRLSLISPEALYATKLAINRGADAAGFSNRIHAGLDVVAPLYATKTELGQRFREARRNRGRTGGGALARRAVQGVAPT